MTVEKNTIIVWISFLLDRFFTTLTNLNFIGFSGSSTLAVMDDRGKYPHFWRTIQANSASFRPWFYSLIQTQQPLPLDATKLPPGAKHLLGKIPVSNVYESSSIADMTPDTKALFNNFLPLRTSFIQGGLVIASEELDFSGIKIPRNSQGKITNCYPIASCYPSASTLASGKVKKLEVEFSGTPYNVTTDMLNQFKIRSKDAVAGADRLELVGEDLDKEIGVGFRGFKNGLSCEHNQLQLF